MPIGGGKKVCRYRATVVLYSVLPATRGQPTSRENKRSRSRRRLTKSYPKCIVDLTKVVTQPPTIEQREELHYPSGVTPRAAGFLSLQLSPPPVLGQPRTDEGRR